MVDNELVGRPIMIFSFAGLCPCVTRLFAALFSRITRLMLLVVVIPYPHVFLLSVTCAFFADLIDTTASAPGPELP